MESEKKYDIDDKLSELIIEYSLNQSTKISAEINMRELSKEIYKEYYLKTKRYPGDIDSFVLGATYIIENMFNVIWKQGYDEGLEENFL